MGHEARARVAEEARRASLSTEPRPAAGLGLSPFLEELVRNTAAECLGHSSALRQAMAPRRVVGPGEAAGRPQIDFPSEVLGMLARLETTQAVILDVLLSVTTGAPGLKPMRAAQAPRADEGEGDEAPSPVVLAES